MRIGVVGLGIMGGSMAAALKQSGHFIIGIDQYQDTVQMALQRQMIDQGNIEVDNLKEVDLILWALYPTQLVDWIKTHQEKLVSNPLILEISGVKSNLLPNAQALYQGNEIVGIHPMCGKEARGIAQADPTIFSGSNFLVIPHQNSQEALKKAKKIGIDLGCAQISELSIEQHDEMIGFLSQLTHVIAVTLMNTHDHHHLVQYTGDSFRDLTRIAKINEDLWTELFLNNKAILLKEIEAFNQSLDRFTKYLIEEDIKHMKAFFKEASRRRALFDRH